MITVPIVWSPTKDLVIQIGKTPKRMDLAGPFESSSIIYRGEQVKVVRDIRIVVDAFAAQTWMRVVLAISPSRGKMFGEVPEGLVEALREQGIFVEVIDCDQANIGLAALVEQVCADWHMQTGSEESPRLLCSRRIAEVVESEQLCRTPVVVDGVPDSYVYVEGKTEDGDEIYRPGEALAVEVFAGDDVELLRSAPHPSAPWSCLVRCPRHRATTVPLPIGRHPAKQQSITGGGMFVDVTVGEKVVHCFFEFA